MTDRARHRAQTGGPPGIGFAPGNGGAPFGAMAAPSLRFPDDEERGKRDDDHRVRPRSAWSQISAVWRRPAPYRRRRLLLWVLGVVGVWLFWRHLPPAPDRSGTGRTLMVPDAAGGEEPVGPPPRPVEEVDDAGDGPSQWYYAGKVRFFRLAASLHTVAQVMASYKGGNRNVLFAASSLRSASVLIPWACEMARARRSYVHVAFMGREDLAVEDIIAMNGVDLDECRLFWHDARPDYTRWSTDARAERSVASALNYIERAVRPLSVVTDDPGREDGFFVAAVERKARETGRPVITIPKGSADSLRWITRLEAGALSMLHKVTVDILIQAPARSAGSLIRLLRSLRSADYAGLTPPRLVIELPPYVELSARRFLDDFTWPPNRGKTDPNRLVLRHRVPYSRLAPEAAAVRAVESFYPTDATRSHVLLLSPQVELAPAYYHYLTYNLLEYRYSSSRPTDAWYLMGVSLDHPSIYLNGSAFRSPDTSQMNAARYTDARPSRDAPFLWQAPDSAAALYFGDKWMELHSFLTRRLAATTAPTRDRLVAGSFPSWMEYALELMRAHGYQLIYPGVGGANSLATVHNELYHIPDEFARPTPEDEPPDVEAPDATEPFLEGGDPASPPPRPEPELASPAVPVHELLPFEGELPEVAHMAHLMFDGEVRSSEAVRGHADMYAEEFRQMVGGCAKPPHGKRRKRREGDAGDLFCDEDGAVGEGEWEDIPAPQLVDR